MKTVIRLGRSVHVHGRLGNEILLGFDNVSQIMNRELCKDEEICYSYITPD